MGADAMHESVFSERFGDSMFLKLGFFVRNML